jgi:hypothetical protein
VYILYLDEFGHDGKWIPGDPQYGHHPLFGLAGFVIREEFWRDLDRGYLQLKKSFFKHELERALVVDGQRPERFEAKSLSNRRDLRFAGAVLELIERLDGAVFAQGLVKPIGAKHDSNALYGSTMQALMYSYERFLRDKARPGMIVLDRRAEEHDVALLGSAQSYLFSAPPVQLPGGFKRVVEVPFLVRSEWHHGVQAADTVARVVGKVFRARAGDAHYAKFDKIMGPRLDAAGCTWGNLPFTSIHVRGVSPSRPLSAAS